MCKKIHSVQKDCSATDEGLNAGAGHELQSKFFCLVLTLSWSFWFWWWIHA